MDRKAETKDKGLVVTRRRALECLAWGGTGLLWTMAGGVPVATALSDAANAAETGKGSKAFRFVQISDDLKAFIGAYDPATWRSPADAMATPFYHWE